MTNRTPLPPKDVSAGFWAASERNGFKAQAVWGWAAEAVMSQFALTPNEARDLLDGDVGVLLANDLSFIEGGPTSADAIEALLAARLRHLGWRRLYQQAIAEIRLHGRKHLVAAVQTPAREC